jgi:23S rRNA pseudouridine2457 synthase
MSILLFNKPYGVICQFTGEKEDRTLADYIPFPNFYAAGRLDKNSEGLLLLTDNGQLQHRLSHPKYQKKKYYWVQVEGTPDKEDLVPLKTGLNLEKISFLPAAVKLIDTPSKLWTRIPDIRYRANIKTSWLEIILREGKNHQIRRMTAAIGFPTLRLIRYQIANWSLGSLLPGEYQLLSNNEAIR